MVAVEIAASQLPAQRVVQPQFAAGLAQALDPGAAQAEAAEAVEQAAHGDAPAAGIQQGDEKQFGAMPVFHQVQLQLDARCAASMASSMRGKNRTPSLSRAKRLSLRQERPPLTAK